MIQKIEELSMNALPAFSTILVNGWIVRLANGYTKRANSVNSIYECSIDIEENIDLCDVIFRENGLDTVFKLTQSEDSYKTDSILSDKGYAYEAKTNIMLKDISTFQLGKDENKNIEIYDEFNENWFNAFVIMNKVSPQNVLTLEKMLKNIVPDTYYGCVVDSGKILAVGLGVAERGYLGIYDIYVDDKNRRMGLGMKIMRHLISKALERGCKYSYLQVVDTNEAAKTLYEKLGYEIQYSYWYRVKKLNK